MGRRMLVSTMAALLLGGCGTFDTLEDHGPARARLASEEPPAPAIAFTRSTGDLGDEVYVIGNAGADVTRLSQAAAYDGDAAWSPDGSRVAFASTRNGNTDIYVMNADGADPTQLTHHPDDDTHPTWSPDGTKIAFTRDTNEPDTFHHQIYVMTTDGSNQSSLTTANGNNTQASWSPDGTKIAFTSTRDGNAEIYVTDADGTNDTRLTDDPSQDHDPTWSPNGNHIAFTTDRDGNAEIYTITLDGKQTTNLTQHDADDRAPAWRRGSHLLGGFLPPVEVPPAVNDGVAGRTVPINFRFPGEPGLHVLDGPPSSEELDCGTSEPMGELEPTRTPGRSGLTYDPTSDEFTYVWQTDRSWSGTCRTFLLHLIDGTTREAHFAFR